MDLGTMINRMIRAAMLDVNLYEEVEADTSLNQEALMVVILVSIAAGISAFLGGILGGNIGAAIGGLILMVIIGIINYYIWAYVTYFIGTNLFQGTANVGELLRTLGYASAPRILGILGFIPCVGWLLALAGAVWSLVTAVVAVRQALDLDDTVKAIITVVIGWVIILIIQFVLLAIFGTAFGIGMAGLGALGGG